MERREEERPGMRLVELWVPDLNGSAGRRSSGVSRCWRAREWMSRRCWSFWKIQVPGVEANERMRGGGKVVLPLSLECVQQMLLRCVIG